MSPFGLVLHLCIKHLLLVFIGSRTVVEATVNYLCHSSHCQINVQKCPSTVA